MALPPTLAVSFGYKSVLKTLWLKGQLPSVEKGFYGGMLSKAKKSKNLVTLEHVQPHSKGGASDISNYVLATLENNNKRANRPLSEFYNKQNADEFFSQLEGVKVKYKEGGKTKWFIGDEYNKVAKENVRKVLEKEGKLDLLA